MAARRRVRARKKPLAVPGLASQAGRRELRKGALPMLKLPRRSGHKVRARWFQSRAAWPWKEPSSSHLARERLRGRRVPAEPGTQTWLCVGPTNIGGRATSLTVDPRDPNNILLGAAGGGVWSSQDAGRSWKPLWHKRDLNVGALARDTSNPDVVYCGTGEANQSADSYPGVGLYRSSNAGRTWRLLASSARTGIPTRIGSIAVDPFNRKHIRLGGIGYSEDAAGGHYASTDGGRTWKRETFISERNYWCHQVLFHPTRRGWIFCAATERGMRNGIWRSTDGGSTWSQLQSGLPAADRMGRAGLAIAPSQPDTVYCQVADDVDGVLGVFRSTNAGQTWRAVGGDHFSREGQMFYNNTIVVHPTKPGHVLCGGVDLHLTEDAGRNWRKATRWDARRGTPTYAHADHHALAMVPSAPDRVYDANDGGLDVSEDGGRTWSNRSHGLAITMFYDLDVAQTTPATYGGGAQDNGTLVTTTGEPDGFFELLGGDGGWILIDPADENHVFASYQFMGLYRFRGSSWADVAPPASESERQSTWMAFLCLDPSDPKVVYAGSTRLWLTRNDGNSWKPISPHFDRSPVTAIEVAPADPRRLYVGTENGGFFRSTDAGAKWTANLAGAELPGFTITRVETSPVSADVLFVTVANTGHSHVFRSEDGGDSWSDVDGGQLPDVPHHAILIRPDAPDHVYVSNDVGVFASQNGGRTWRNLTRNLPYVPVVDLVYQSAERTLTAATYGRSLWRMKA